MIRKWAAIAILAVSWLPGLGYFHLADGLWWAVAVAGGTALLLGAGPRQVGRGRGVAALVLLVPVAVIWPWPFRLIPIFMAAGLALALLPMPRAWPKRLGGTLVAAGIVLLAQAAALTVYAAVTARSRDLPEPLAHALGVVAAAIGQEAGTSNATLALFSMREVHRLAASWELVLAPSTVAFLAGGLAYLAFGRPDAWSWRRAVALMAAVLVWLPVRLALMVGLYMHRALVTDYDEPFALMAQFWSTPLHVALLAGPVLLVWRFIGKPGAPAPAALAPESPAAPAHADGDATGAPAPAPGTAGWQPEAIGPRHVLGMVLVAAAAAVLTAAVTYDAVGERQAGRVAIEEGHSTWEPTTKPMDTEWYGHDSGYNYACLYEYLDRFYEMSRLTEPIADATLADVDVLMLKTPTSPYAAEEIEAIRRFVERGGGLMLVGEHTNVFHTGEYLNTVARLYGFTFRYDCLFGIDTFFEQRYELPLVPHPMVQHMPGLDFSVACSLDPGASCGRAVILDRGLKSAPADYHASNYYPQARDRPDMRYGTFVQLWATRAGQGRVVAFTDSTIFSNFSMFEPGKPELMLGMVEWANHRGGWRRARPALAGAGAVLALLGLVLARGRRGIGVLLIAAVLAGHVAAAVGIRDLHRRAMPMPEARRPYVMATIDRTASDVVLSKGGFIGGRDRGFGIFERWILRLGYFIRRAEGPEARRGALVVEIDPSLDVPAEHVTALAEYVKAGGHLLVLDSAQNQGSTANSLLWPYDLSVDHRQALAGPLSVPEGWPSVPVEAACEVKGGTPWASVQGRPVGTTAAVGNGTVTVIGFSSRFSDRKMGVTGDVVPDEKLRKVFDLQYGILRAIVEGKPPIR